MIEDQAMAQESLGRDDSKEKWQNPNKGDDSKEKWQKPNKSLLTYANTPRSSDKTLNEALILSMLFFYSFKKDFPVKAMCDFCIQEFMELFEFVKSSMIKMKGRRGPKDKKCRWICFS